MARFTTISSVADAFAFGLAAKASASHLSFEGNFAYSYTTCIAVRTGKAMFITTERYSNTTVQHKSLIDRAARATPVAKPVIYVLEPRDPTGDASIDELLDRMDNLITKACNTRCRMQNRIWSLECAEGLLKDLTFLLEDYDPAWHTKNERINHAVADAYRVLGELPTTTLRDFHFNTDKPSKHTPQTLDTLIRLRAIAALAAQ